MPPNQHYSRDQHTRPTIGLLFPDTETIHNLMWLGAADAARQLGANLIFFEGAELDHPYDFKAQGNVLYDLVDPARIDGLILWTLDLFSTPEQLQEFARRYHPLPMVSVEHVIDGIPNLLMDNITGMKAVVSHLIESHGYRRIAFIRGPSSHIGAEERYQAYCATLAAHGIELDASIVSPPSPDWSETTGAAMLDLLLDTCEAPFEAVMAANDRLAFGVLGRVQERGLRVPGDMAIAGFDFDVRGSACTPQLTTVRPPFYEMGRRAVELLLTQLRGETVPALVTSSAELVTRRSCGCVSPAVAHAAAGPIARYSWQLADDLTLATAVVGQRPHILAELERAIGAQVAELHHGWAVQLLDAALADLDGHVTGGFLATLEQLSSHAISPINGVEPWQQLLSSLRRQLLPYLLETDRLLPAEDLWQQARTLLGELAQRVELARNMEAELRARTFRELGQALITTFDVAKLMDIIARELPRMGIPRCYLSLYDSPDAPSAGAHLIMAYDEQGRYALPPQGQGFPAPRLVPDTLWDSARPCSIVVEPLYFQDQQLGFILFEAGPRDGWVYAALRGQLSSAVQGALLVQREQRALADVLAAQTQTQKLATELATVAEVSTAASTQLEIAKLLQTVVDLTKTSFGLAHVHIYLLDPAGDTLVLVAGAGAAARQLLAEGWSMPLSHQHSLVAHTARTHQGGIVNSLQAAPHWVPAPLRSDTQAELAVPLLVGGQVLGVLDVHADMAERFTADDLRIQSTLAAQVAVAIQNARLYHEAAEARQAAEEANDFKTKFIANMSHELRTPLNAILNFTRFLSKPRYGPLTERQLELQGRVLANAEHLLGLINDILDLAKIEAGRMDLFQEDSELLPLLQGVMATAVGLTKDKGLDLTLDVPDTLPRLQIDKTRVRQVLLNLLSNAAKFTERGGITVRAYLDQRPTTNDQRAAAADNGHAGLKGDDKSFVVRRSSFVVIEVRDTGVGIAPEHQALVFEEFRQIDGALNRQQQGTGLGLPISKRLVEMHGGSMWLESTPGVGSTFSFSLPIEQPVALPDITIVEPHMSDSRAAVSVVVVDDDPDAQAILHQYLASVDYQVHAVLDSRQALATIQRVRPQLVLLDVEMPHMDGWEVLAQLRTTPETAMIPVIICSVVDQQQLGIALGVCAHLVKPVDEAALLALVQRYATASATVLVVDDDPDARQVVRGILDGMSYRVIEACDGTTGLRLVQQHNPELIILDLMLPELDGFELLAQLRAQPAHAERPVIVVSAKDLTLDERRWLCSRAQHTIHKHQLSAAEFLASAQRLIAKEPIHGK